VWIGSEQLDIVHHTLDHFEGSVGSGVVDVNSLELEMERRSVSGGQADDILANPLQLILFVWELDVVFYFVFKSWTLAWRFIIWLRRLIFDINFIFVNNELFCVIVYS